MLEDIRRTCRVLLGKYPGSDNFVTKYQRYEVYMKLYLMRLDRTRIQSGPHSYLSLTMLNQ